MNRTAITVLGALATLLLQPACSRDSRRLASDAARSGSRSTAILTLTSGTFPSVQGQPKPVLIDFWAPWCGPCRVQGPILDDVAGQIGDKAVIAKVNVDEASDLARTFNIQAIPTLVILKDGKVVQRFTGVQQADTLMRALNAAGA